MFLEGRDAARLKSPNIYTAGSRRSENRTIISLLSSPVGLTQIRENRTIENKTRENIKAVRCFQGHTSSHPPPPPPPPGNMVFSQVWQATRGPKGGRIGLYHPTAFSTHRTHGFIPYIVSIIAPA